MNKKLILFLSVLSVGVLFFTHKAYAEDGSPGDPWLVDDCTELQAIGSGIGGWDLDKYYLLDNDIDCTGIDFLPIGSTIGPAPFIGSLDGQNHNITNFVISQAGNNDIGMFALIGDGGVVQNITFASGSVTGNNDVGALAGNAWTGVITINNITSNLDVHGFDSQVGGLIGQALGTDANNPLTISDCIVNGDVVSDDTIGNASDFGGLVGYADSVTITGSHVTGDITIAIDNDISYIGGLVGQGNNNMDVTSSDYAGNINLTSNNSYIDYIGGAIGYFYSTDPVIDDVHATTNITISSPTSSNDYIGGLIGYADNAGTGFTISGSYHSGILDLDASSATYVGGIVGYYASNNIILDTDYHTGNISVTTGGGAIQFFGGVIGNISGGDGTLTDVYAEGDITLTSGGNYVEEVGGLIGALGNQLTLTNTHYAGNMLLTADLDVTYIGGLVGYTVGDAVSITNSYVEGNITTNSATSYSMYIAGIFGHEGSVDPITVIGVYYEGNISVSANAETDYIAGLFGYISPAATITQSYADTNITATSATTEASNIGGLIGEFGPGVGGTLGESYARGTITVSGVTTISGLGGLVGLFQGTQDIVDSFAWVDVSGESEVGGLVGWMETGTSISNSYAIGSVTGSENLGGLVGRSGTGGLSTNSISDSFSAGVVTEGGATFFGGFVGRYQGTLTLDNNFFDVTKSEQTLCASQDGGGTANCTGVNIADAAPAYFLDNDTNSPLDIWDFLATWETNVCYYPTLANVLISLIPTLCPTLTTEPATAITDTGATLNGNISDEGGSVVTERGFEYGLDLLYGATLSEAVAGTGDFDLDVTGLTCATTYNFRAYATNKYGTTNGANDTFDTAACPDGESGGSTVIGSIASPPPTEPEHPVAPPIVPTPPPPQAPQPPQPPPTPPHEAIPPPPSAEVIHVPTPNPSPSPNALPSFSSKLLRLGSLQVMLPLFLLFPLIDTTLSTLRFFGSPNSFAFLTSWLFAFPQPFRRKRKLNPWGVVYNSYTKQPLAYARVEIYNSLGKLLETTVTDNDGRYAFLLRRPTLSEEKLQVSLVVKLNNYAFPSQKQPSETDHILYPHIYRGGIIDVNEGTAGFDLPLDPPLNQQAMNMKTIGMHLNIWSIRSINASYWLALILSAIICYLNPISPNLYIFGFSIIVGLLRTVGLRSRPFGVIKDKFTQELLPFSFVILKDLEGQRVNFAVSDQRASYFLLAPKGEFELQVYTPSSIQPTRMTEEKIQTDGWVAKRLVV